jgi:hypothetical protein
MKARLVFILFLSLGNFVFAQHIIRMEPVNDEPKVTFVGGDRNQVQKEFGGKKIYSSEDYSLCLFHYTELVEAYAAISGLQKFYEERKSTELWNNTLQRLLWDRQTTALDWNLSKASNTATGTTNEKSKKPLASPFDILTAELYDELNFCLQYLMIKHNDKLLTEEYLIPRKKLINDLNNTDLTNRQKAWILANDMYDRIQGLSTGFLL